MTEKDTGNELHSGQHFDASEKQIFNHFRDKERNECWS